jgi:hypothetical protein
MKLPAGVDLGNIRTGFGKRETRWKHVVKSASPPIEHRRWAPVFCSEPVVKARHFLHDIGKSNF